MSGNPHLWYPDTAYSNGALTPVMRCLNRGCRVVWWCDRNEPRSECQGTADTKGAA